MPVFFSYDSRPTSSPFAGASADGNLGAAGLLGDADTIAWNPGAVGRVGRTPALRGDGGLAPGADGVTGGETLTLRRRGSRRRRRSSRTWRLCRLPYRPDRPRRVPAALRADRRVRRGRRAAPWSTATGLQIQGVLDDLYTYDAGRADVRGRVPTLASGRRRRTRSSSTSRRLRRAPSPPSR